jgi:hypothetical protein
VSEAGFFEKLWQSIRLKCHRENYCALIASYMDESFDMGGKGVFAVGGMLGRGVPLFELERRWEQLLKRPDIDIEYFKASECERGKGQFAKFVRDPKNITPSERDKLDLISHGFLELIVHPVTFDPRSYLPIQGLGVVQEDFYEVIGSSDRARAVLGESPYRLAYDLAMIQCAWSMKELEKAIKEDKQRKMDSSSSREYVSFVCDEDEEHSADASEAYRDLKGKNPKAAEYMATFSSASDKQCAPLQAADAAVFEVRRALNVSLKQWPGILRKQFNLLADSHVMFLISHVSRVNLLHIVETHQPGEPFHLDAFMDAEFNENIKFSV